MFCSFKKNALTYIVGLEVHHSPVKFAGLREVQWLALSHTAGTQLPAQWFQVPNSFQDPMLLSPNLKHLRAVPDPRPQIVGEQPRWVQGDILKSLMTIPPYLSLSYQDPWLSSETTENSLVVLTKKPSIHNPRPIELWPFLGKWQISLALGMGRNAIVHRTQFVRWVVGGQESVWLTNFSGG